MTFGWTVEKGSLTGAAGAWIVHNRHHLALVVCAAAAVTAIAVFWIGPWLSQEPWLGRARAAHSIWVETDRIPGGRVLDVKGFLGGLRQLGPPPHLPDLSANGLVIRQVSYVPPAGDRPGAIHAGYVEPAGCRISLWITPTGEAGSGPLVEHHRGIAFSWHVGGLRYVLVRSDMRHERFHFLAKIARETTVARKGPDGAKLFALAIGGMTGRPCES